MKVRNLFGWLCVLALGVASVSCSDDDPEWNDDGSKIDLPHNRVYILNEGSQNKNNAGIAFYAPKNDAEKIVDIFYEQNGKRLGEIAQSMIEYRDKIYVAVYGSNYLARLNAACVEEASVSFVNDPDLSAGIRYIDAEGGYIYASFYGGVVAKINANTLVVEAKLKTGGANLEGVAIEDDNLYVANSYEKVLDPVTNKNQYVYKTDVYVIDLRSFSLKGTLAVSQNPNDLIEEDDKVFLISWGNYKDKGYSFQMIDPKKNNQVSEIAVATKMAGGNDIVYLVNSVTDWSIYLTTNTFFYYDIKTGRLHEESFLKNAPAELASSSVYMMAVDEESGDIYISTSSYTANGDIYRFKKDGTFVEKFDCGGMNPKAVVFFD